MISDALAIKECFFCKQPLKGRTDKKFCSDYCRNQYNNQIKGADNNVIRNINNALRKNRNILKDFFPDSLKTTKIHCNKLNASGFNFKYNIHQHHTNNRSIYFYCYDYGYLTLEDNWSLIVRSN